MAKITILNSKIVEIKSKEEIKNKMKENHEEFINELENNHKVEIKRKEEVNKQIKQVSISKVIFNIHILVLNWVEDRNGNISLTYE